MWKSENKNVSIQMATNEKKTKRKTKKQWIDEMRKDLEIQEVKKGKMKSRIRIIKEHQHSKNS